MRRRVAVALAAAVLLLTGCDSGVPGPGEAKIDVDTPALRDLKAATGVEQCAPGAGSDSGLPQQTLPCLGGGPAVDLAALEGPVILNLWASNCGPCRKEMPALQDFYERYGDRVGVIGVDYQDRQPAAALELAGRSGVTYPLVADPGGDLNGADPIPVIRGIPIFVLLGADGEVSVAAGGVDSAADVVDLVRTKLGIDL
jgi:thiol-disulfide isomerase/thioredoxin